jgi:hypothetical protein
MSIREIILEQLLDDINKVKTANGYVHDAPAPFNNLNALDDASVLPVISVVLGTEESELTEAGLETNLKAIIITRFKVDTDINKTGLVTSEAESWFSDYEKLFRRPVNPDVNLNIISGLWDVDSEAGGVDYYYISSKDPFADDLKDNRQTILVELTISIINNNT